MDSAQLRMAKIELYRLKEGDSDYGMYKNDLELYYTTRASVSNDSQNRELDNGEIFYSTQVTFYVRHYVPVENETFIKWNNQYWRVISCLPDVYYNNKVITAELVNE